MLIFFFILLDVCMFSILSIPIYRVLCEPSVVLYAGYGDSSLTGLHFYICLFASIDTIISVSGLNIYSSFVYSLSHLFESFVSECVCRLWHLVPMVSLLQNSISTSVLQIALFIRRSNLGLLEFYALQQRLCVAHDEITLAFFRVYNPTHYSYSSIFVYLVYPLLISAYVNKVQCFCFECLLVRPFETFDLPVLFFVCSDIGNVPFCDLDKLAFLYVLFLI